MRFAGEKKKSCSPYIKPPLEGRLLEDVSSQPLAGAGQNELLGLRPNPAFF